MCILFAVATVFPYLFLYSFCSLMVLSRGIRHRMEFLDKQFILTPLNCRFAQSNASIMSIELNTDWPFQLRMAIKCQNNAVCSNFLQSTPCIFAFSA